MSPSFSHLLDAIEASAQPLGATCGFHWVRRQFGQGRKRCSDARFAQFLEDLIETDGFPRPLPQPKHGGGIERGVNDGSEWIRAGVVEWLGKFLPPDAADALDVQAMRAAADDMDAAVQLLLPKPQLAIDNTRRGAA